MLVASFSVTLPVCTFWSGPKVRPAACTSCGVAPVLVTVTGQLSAVPGAPTAFSWLVLVSRVSPVGFGEPSLVCTDSAALTAL